MAVKKVRLAAGLAEVEFDGIVVPATTVGGKVVSSARARSRSSLPASSNSSGAVRLEETFDEAVRKIMNVPQRHHITVVSMASGFLDQYVDDTGLLKAFPNSSTRKRGFF